MRTARFVIEARPPFRLDLNVWTLRRRPHNTIDAWDGTTYTRTLVAAGTSLLVAVRQEPDGEPGRVRLGVKVRGCGATPSEAAVVEV